MASVGGLGPLLGPMLAVLVALGTYVGGPGGSKAEKWPKPEQDHGPKERGLRPRALNSANSLGWTRSA